MMSAVSPLVKTSETTLIQELESRWFRGFESKVEATKAIEIAKAAGVSEDEFKPTIELIDKIGKIK